MKFSRFLLTLIAPVLLAIPAVAQDDEDKIATVDMSRLVNDYYKSAEARDTFKEYQTDIQKQDGERLETIKELAQAAQKLQQDAEDPSLSAEKRGELFKQSTSKQREAQGLQEERISWLKRKQAALNEKAAMEFGDIRKELMEIVQKVGDEEGYDFIFDRSGASGAGVAVLVYTKDATDLTGLLLERINKDAPEKTDGE
ncbi:MAG: OmpH family outer membrane protein [Verrucomicrobiaceae bacterium]